MRKIWNLLRLQIDNKTDLLNTASPRKMGTAILKCILLLAVITGLLAFAFMRIFVLGFSINRELIAVILLITQSITLVFTVGHVIGTLYLSRDNELLICLPVTPNQFFISKLLLIYLKELGFNSLISLPLFLCLGIFGGLGTSFYCAIPLYLILLPILPIILAAFISIPVMRVLAFLKRHTLLSIFALLAVVATCISLYITLLSGIADSFNIVEQQMKVVSEINTAILRMGQHTLIYYRLAMAMFSFSYWYYIPLFLAICAALTVLTVLVIRPFYFKIAMPQLENRVRTLRRTKSRFRRDIPFISLIRKEALCIFRSPSDVFQYFLFTLLMPFIVFSYDKLLMTVTVNQAGVNMIAGSHVMIVAIMAMLSNISSASAISRDGANFHTSKIIPVDYFTQIFAKLTFNAIFTVGALLATAVISCFVYPAWQVLLGTLAVMLAAIGHIALCLDMDIKSPTLNMQGDEESSTTSKSTPKALIAGLVIGFLLGIMVILMSSVKLAVVPYLIIILLSLAFAIWRVWMLILRVQLAYDKIEM